MSRVGSVVVTGVLSIGVCLAAGAQELLDQFQGPDVERLLEQAGIGGMRTLTSGASPTRRATLDWNGETREALFKDVEYQRPGITRLSSGTTIANMEENWRFEVAAYRIDRLIGLGMVPATVEREYRGVKGSLQWSIDGAMTEATRVDRGLQPPDREAWGRQWLAVWLFDNLIDSWDRHANNVLVTPDFALRLTDHARAFLPNQDLRRAERLTLFSRRLLDGLRNLTRESLEEAVGDYLVGSKIDALLDRRDAILERAAALVAERGEEVVLYP